MTRPPGNAGRLFDVACAWLLALMLLTFVVGNSGCGASPARKVIAAEQTYTEVANTLNVAIQQKQITDRDTLIAIREGALEVDAALDDAKARAIAGERIGFEFAWARANAALDRFLLIYLKQQEAERAD